MADIFVSNSTNHAISKKGMSRRRGLVDITNLPSKQKVSNDGKQLQQENATLTKHFEENNKMVEIEIQKLRADLQKYQQQNSQLAQAHSQMSYQLNAAKDKLKVLQHELSCRNNLLAESLKLLDVKKLGQCQEIDSKRATSKEAGVSSQADRNNDKPCSTNSGDHLRAQGQSAAKGAMSEEDPDNRRYQTGRQNSRFKSVGMEPAEDMPATNVVAFQRVDKRPEDCPMSVISGSGEGYPEAFVSSSADIDGRRPCTNNDKHPRQVKRGSIVKHASNSEVLETKRPRTRSSMLNSEEQQEDFKVYAKFVLPPLHEGEKVVDCAPSLSPSVNTKDVVKEKADLSVPQEVRKIQDLKVTLQADNPCSSGTEIGQLRATGLSTANASSQVEKTEIKRTCSSRQSSRLKCKDEEPSGSHPQNANNNGKPENHSVELTVPENTEKLEREDVLPEQVKISSVGRPLRRAAEKVQSYKEISLKVKMRRPG